MITVRDSSGRNRNGSARNTSSRRFSGWSKATSNGSHGCFATSNTASRGSLPIAS